MTALTYNGWMIFPRSGALNAQSALEYQHVDYSGSDDFNDQRFGYAATVDEAQRRIDALNDVIRKFDGACLPCGGLGKIPTHRGAPADVDICPICIGDGVARKAAA